MFAIHSSDKVAVLPSEYLPAAAGTYEPGQILNTASGKLAAIASASTAKPQYLCVGHVVAAAGDLVPVVRVSDDVIFETTLSAAAASAGVGSMLEVSAGGKAVDGASAGKFEVVYLDGTTVGSMVRGRFVG